MTDDRRIPGWPTFDPAVLEHESDRKCFLNRKSAVDLRLIDRKRPSEVLQTTNIRPTDLKGLISRCLETHPDDQLPYGYRALVPHLKTRYERLSPESPGLPRGRGKSGLFAALMATHQANLKDYVTELFLRGKRLANGAYQPQSSNEIYELFLERCRLLLYPKDGSEPLVKPYPFSTPSNGERSFYRFLQELRGQHALQVIAQEQGADAATAFSTDSHGETIQRVRRILRSVMLDGHHIAAEGVVRVPQPSGMPSLIQLSDVMSVDWIDRDQSIVFGHHCDARSKTEPLRAR